MADGFPDRLTQLRARWQGDPSSRVFLQLAEEYRHLGRVQDALQVLDAGLKEHPGYLSALVAKGRCLLELGDAGAARGVLERVVQQDATQMVANKLLVRAYLETGEPERAGQRLDLYSLLNDSDPEIAELRQRVVAMSRPPRAPDGPRPEEPAERSRMDPSETPSPETAEVFDLGPAASAHSLAAGDDVFGLGLQAPGRGEGPAAEPAATAPAGQAAPAIHAEAAGHGAAPTSALGARGDGNGAEPFPDPAPEQSRRLYLASFAAERIFWFDEAAAQPAPEQAATAAPVAEEPVPAAIAAPAAEEPVPAAITAPAVESPAAVMAAAPVAESPAAESPAPAAPATSVAAVASVATTASVPTAATVATVTLAELYLRQGHTEEAERMFGEIVQREPGNAAAREGLARLTDARPAPRQERLDAGQLLAGLNDPQASPTARRAYLLQSYLARLRPRRSHVP
jgi:thioredoxin-like negative regulator of GroEL